MRAKDIKIGDLVAYDGHNVRVDSVSRQLCILKGGNLTYTVAPKEIDGIDLTEDILARNGWELDEVQKILVLSLSKRDNEFLKAVPYSDGGTGESPLFIIVKEEEFVSVTLNSEVVYVHELQHILCALGLNDKMKV